MLRNVVTSEAPRAASLVALRSLRRVGWLEGGSFLLLLFVAMPLKYLAGLPLAVRVVGMAHGLLFLWYLLVLAQAASARRWQWRRTALGFLASIVPFGVFALDRSLRAEEERIGAAAPGI